MTVPDPSTSREDEGDSVRLGRRRFLSAGLAAAGTALIPPAAAARSRAIFSDPIAAPAASSIGQLPLRDKYPHLPAVPFDAGGAADTLVRLALRAQQATQAKQGLTREFTIGGQKQTAYALLFGGAGTAAESEALREHAESWRAHPRRSAANLQRTLGRRSDKALSAAASLTLESPEQFSLSWTYFPNVFEAGRPHLQTWASSLTDVEAATSQFWPMIAEHGYGFNLIIPERVGDARAGALRQAFGPAWTRQVRAALAAGNLYVIDMSRFESLTPQMVNGSARFTPATMTLLIRNRHTMSLTPVAIIVSGQNGAGRQLYQESSASKGAWLYALQAAKASITLYGVWIGHVYHWHIVTAAMQMAMLNTLPTDHPISLLLAPQSKFLIQFDDVLLVAWSQIAPPTPLTTADDFLALANGFATGRTYFEDDPTTTIQRLDLRASDFTDKTRWDRYPVVQRLLTLWDLVSEYVDAFVRTTYPSDASVAADQNLQTWIATAASPDATTGGNIRGLPAMDSRDALERTLTSHLYRITAHGISRLNSTPNPALTFMANYPHCLQRTDIPSAQAAIDTKTLLSYLPKTDTIGLALNFYSIFAFSPPYESFIPLGGVDSELFFPGGSAEPRNRALIQLRNGLASFIEDYQPDMPQRFQWPRNIET